MASYMLFLNKHNAYKHIQPGINEKNKHMLSIVSSKENSCSFFFPVSNVIQRHIQIMSNILDEAFTENS